jgi:hypothetical protein
MQGPCNFPWGGSRFSWAQVGNPLLVSRCVNLRNFLEKSFSVPADQSFTLEALRNPESTVLKVHVAGVALLFWLVGSVFLLLLKQSHNKWHKKFKERGGETGKIYRSFPVSGGVPLRRTLTRGFVTRNGRAFSSHNGS